MEGWHIGKNAKNLNSEYDKCDRLEQTVEWRETVQNVLQKVNKSKSY